MPDPPTTLQWGHLAHSFFVNHTPRSTKRQKKQGPSTSSRQWIDGDALSTCESTCSCFVVLAKNHCPTPARALCSIDDKGQKQSMRRGEGEGMRGASRENEKRAFLCIRCFSASLLCPKMSFQRCKVCPTHARSHYARCFFHTGLLASLYPSSG